MTRREITVAAASAAILAVAWAAGEFWAFVASLGVCFALLGASLSVLSGWSGQLNLHVAALGLGWGAYAAVALTAHMPVLLALVAAAVVTLPFSVIVGAVAVRFRGLELAVATLALGLAFERLLFRNLGEWLAGAAEGTPFGSSFVGMPRPSIGGWTMSSERSFALLAFALGGLAAWGLWRASGSRLRRVLAAIRDDELAAEVLGVPVLGYRIGAFAGSVMVAGLAGALFASLKLGVSPDAFGLDTSFLILAAVVIGGSRSVWGGAAGGIAAAFLPELVRFGPLQALAGERLFLVFAVGMVLTLWRRPAGLSGEPGPTTAAVPSTGGTEVPAAPGRRPSGVVLRAQGLEVAFGGVRALDGVDIALRAGEVVSVIGPNGAGKSTLFDCLSGVRVPDAGRVYLHGEDVTHMPPHRRATAGLARTFQSVRLFDGLTTLENVMVGAHGHRSEADRASAAQAALDALGVGRFADARPTDLPFGTLRRIEIAAALVGDPTVLLLDEPSAGLEATAATALADAIVGLAADRGMAVLLVEHDMGLVGRISDRVVVLDSGATLASGTPNEVRADPVVVARYLGTDEGVMADAAR